MYIYFCTERQTGDRNREESGMERKRERNERIFHALGSGSVLIQQFVHHPHRRKKYFSKEPIVGFVDLSIS